MLEEKTQSVLNLPYQVQELQVSLQEFLGLLTELPYIQTIPPPSNYLSVVDTLLHILTDVETQLSCALTALESERLIHNHLFMMVKDMARDAQ